MVKSRFSRAVAILVTSISACAFAAPAVDGNEAVTTDAKGRVRVELPPPVRSKSGRPLPETTFHVSEGRDPRGRTTFTPWVYMIETPSGLQECMGPWFEAKGCRASTVGRALAQRFWIVKQRGQWLRCPRATIAGCMPYLSVDGLRTELQ